MKIVGLITEYNPFHNGHKYHIEEALRVTGSDAALVVMSGDFVQRGAPAILPKHLRAEMALRSGAAAILELPVCYATGSAEYFAKGAISILHALGCVSSICFGSECGTIGQLEKIAAILSQEPKEYQKILQDYIKLGYSFPAAREKALAEYTKDEKLAAILSKPNNTLGIEYIKALLQLNSRITPYTIQRLESDYHDDTLQQTYSSASAIRTVFANSDASLAPLNTQVPSSSFDILKENQSKRFPIIADDFSLLLKYKLLTETKDSLTRYADITQELANRIIGKRNEFVSWQQFCNILKTKEVTFSRISRCLLHILLGITKEQMDLYKTAPAHYARLLGFRKEQSELLGQIKQNTQIPLITKLGNESPLSETGTTMLKTDIFSSDLYESVVTDKFKIPFVNEYEKQVVVIRS